MRVRSSRILAISSNKIEFLDTHFSTIFFVSNHVAEFLWYNQMFFSIYIVFVISYQYTAQVVLGRGENRAISCFPNILFEGYTYSDKGKHGSNAIQQVCVGEGNGADLYN